MSWKTVYNTYRGAPTLLHLAFPLSIVRIIFFTASPLDVAIFIYVVYYSLGLPLLIQPYLNRTTGGTDRDKEMPYLLIPLVVLGFLMFIYGVGSYYFSHGIFPTGISFSVPFATFLLSIAASLYFGVILPKVFHISFHERSIIKPITAARMFSLILPSLFGTVASLLLLIGSVFSLFIPTFGEVPFEMELSSVWIIVPICLVILGLLNRVWLRPSLLRTKGRVSRDDQLPYFVVPTLIVVLSVFLFDAYRYNLGAITIEHLRFSYTAFIVSATILWYTGFTLPRFYHFRFQEFAFTKPLLGNVLTT
ncbi:hypothetical protein, partial [Rhizobium sp. UGM030330-04]|uniref:hypothetical protein n=2 Tax=Pseudomonadota TaxID=1224 RepID=UPI000D97277A